MAHRTAKPRTRKGGRPSKGERHLFQTRVPTALADLVKRDAERVGMNYSDYLAVLVAERYEYQMPEHYRPVPADNTIQEAFPMQTAS